jgi:hypothetical protein
VVAKEGKKGEVDEILWDSIPDSVLKDVERGDRQFTKEMLNTLTIDDLFRNPKLAQVVEKKYPTVYLFLTEHIREISLLKFLHYAKAQEENLEAMADLAPYTDDPKKSLKFAIKVIKENGLGAIMELWINGLPFKFELSKFVEHYAPERTYTEWRKILKDVGATKSNMERILALHSIKFKQ